MYVINDPIHRVMEFDKFEHDTIKPFIDHPNFQRLRRIKQLGLADLVFPGAVHTRFNHCVGCCYVGAQMRKKLFGVKHTKKIQRLQLLANLLHDIGHGPLSHSFENIFDRKIKHEKWTRLFLNDFNSDRTLLRDTKEIDEIEAYINHDKSKNSLLADIVSSQLDADRLDYLLRDSHFCGVSYGQYDFRWLIDCLRTIDDVYPKRLGIAPKGMGVIEHYLAGRRLMTRNIYYHGKVQASEYLMIEFLKLLSKYQLKGVSGKFTQFLSRATEFRTQIRKLTNKAQEEDLAKAFVDRNYPSYKTFSDLDIWNAIEAGCQKTSPKEIHEIALRFKNRQLPKVCAINPAKLEPVKYHFGQLRPHLESSWRVAILDQSTSAYEAKGPIFMRENDRTVRDFGYKSHMFGPLIDKRETVPYLMVDDSDHPDSIAGRKLWNKLYRKHYLSQEVSF